MASLGSTAATYHILLIGVDNYRHGPLRGCVNDIDAIERLVLSERMGVSPDRIRIRRLASPLPGAWHKSAVAELPATLENIRAELAVLASDRVAPGDRVFIYYSGHGSGFHVVAPGGDMFYRVALVPVDHDADPSGARMLFDFELNECLRAILQRTRSVTLMLDCCRSKSGRFEPLSRFLDLAGFLESSTPIPNHSSRDQRVRADECTLGCVAGCYVVSACMNHEIAMEGDGGGVEHGLLTWAFIETLEAATDVDLREVTWARIWQGIRARVGARNAQQHVWMQGNPGREVFGGPPVEGDAGISVSRFGDAYQIAAGTLAGITSLAELAIYGEQPRYFPPLGSDDDRAARLGVVRVVTADRAMASAYAVGAPFDAPPGARARLVKAGSCTRLACAVSPGDQSDDGTARWIKNPLCQRD